MSALIGLIGCGAAGATCRVVIAVPLGAILSGLPCFVLVAFPSTMMMSMSGGNNEPDLQAVWVGFLGMVIVGALAGAFGAQIGKLVARQQ
ncbi:hypothetical protein [Bremerella sp. P1]|uniref:hypothetical protein n=1 Tax=Bremerella sp. P1 TaxID=3026424 RepID=UPI002368AE3A|nr:hypothetical protein [Bremerella sp. P1]WDI44205.1 hypothetical protein PSR63_09700 [Bremerella sp. P1]